MLSSDALDQDIECSIFNFPVSLMISLYNLNIYRNRLDKFSWHFLNIRPSGRRLRRAHVDCGIGRIGGP